MAVMNAMVGVENSRKLKQPSPSQIKKVPPITVTKRLRESKRLHFKNRRNVGLDGHSVKTIHRTVELAKGPIDYGNPSQKLLFLTGLGLVPKSTELSMPPYVKLERFDTPKVMTVNKNRNYHKPEVATSKTEASTLPNTLCRKSDRLHKQQPRLTTMSMTTTNNATPKQETVKEEARNEFKLETQRNNNNNTPILYTDSDIEELDLELLICPLDIPHIFEEFFRKESNLRESNTMDTKNKINTNHNKRNNYSTYLRRQQPIRNNSRNNHNNMRNKKELSRNQRNNIIYSRNRSITQVQALDIPFIDLTEDDIEYEDMSSYPLSPYDAKSFQRDTILYH